MNLFKIFKGALKSNKRVSTIVKDLKYYSSKPSKLLILDKVSPFLDMYIFGGVLIWHAIIFNVFKVGIFTYLEIQYKGNELIK